MKAGSREWGIGNRDSGLGLAISGQPSAVSSTPRSKPVPRDSSLEARGWTRTTQHSALNTHDPQPPLNFRFPIPDSPFPRASHGA
ncbi:MAG: hypothetical protein HC933_10710 [Pleurocapsa sp. SU_196_0]|nr:hypothetical protein [Pleurocapsa sp. SU_196_0]